MIELSFEMKKLFWIVQTYPNAITCILIKERHRENFVFHHFPSHLLLVTNFLSYLLFLSVSVLHKQEDRWIFLYLLFIARRIGNNLLFSCNNIAEKHPPYYFTKNLCIVFQSINVAAYSIILLYVYLDCFNIL